MIQQSQSQAYIQKKRKYQFEDTYISMFIAALFTIAKIWKQTKCPATKMLCVHTHTHTHTHTLAHIWWNITQPLKRMKQCYLLFVATWMDFTLGEVSQEEKDKYHMIPFI